MDDAKRESATRVLTALDRGEDGAVANDLLPLVYDDLRRMAAAHVRERGDGGAVQPTAIVHEAYLRLVDQTRVNWRGRTHFLAIGAQMVRRVLVDEARGRRALKRGGDRRGLTLHEAAALDDGAPTEVGDLDESLRALSEVDARAARVVEMRFFGGMTEVEIAEVLGVSERTVRNDWRMARAWLRRALRGETAREMEAGGPGGGDA